jgi:hypothetical protein
VGNSPIIGLKRYAPLVAMEKVRGEEVLLGRSRISD